MTFDEDKGAKKSIIVIVFMFLLLLGSSAFVLLRGLEKSSLVFRAPGAVEQSVSVESPVQAGDGIHPPIAVPTEDIGDRWVGRANGELVEDDGTSFSSESTTDSGLYWDELRGSPHCLAYGTRRYTARLRNVSFWANHTRACMETPIQINGLMISSPDECDVHASSIVWRRHRIKLTST